VSVREGGRRLCIVYGRRLPLQSRKLPFEVCDEHVGHVVGEPPSDDHAKGGEVGPILGERVRGHLPAALAEGIETSKTVKLSTSSFSANANTGSRSSCFAEHPGV
jgi:hypothetical protein